MKDERQNYSKNLTLDGITGPHAILIILSVLTIATGIYLTIYYFDAHFPTDLSKGSLCQLNATFNCDLTTFSKLSNIWQVPISFFGAMLGLIFLIGSLFPYESVERTNKFIAFFNIILVLVLALYSAFALGGFCPVCMIYWALSGVIAFLFYKYGVKGLMPHPAILVCYLIPTLLLGMALKWNFQNKLVQQTEVGKKVVEQYFSLNNIGDPKQESPFKLLASSEKFEGAPIRLSIFSDFQCPACKRFSDMVPHIIKKYRGKMNIQYFFYPLDDTCNNNMNYPLHPMACKAAFLTICAKPEKFVELHDYLFENQSKLSTKWLNELSEERGLKDCTQKGDGNSLVNAHISSGDTFGIKSTPTLILNGVKIEGAIPLTQFYAIFDAILARAPKK